MSAELEQFARLLTRNCCRYSVTVMVVAFRNQHRVGKADVVRDCWMEQVVDTECRCVTMVKSGYEGAVVSLFTPRGIDNAASTGFRIQFS